MARSEATLVPSKNQIKIAAEAINKAKRIGILAIL